MKIQFIFITKAIVTYFSLFVILYDIFAKYKYIKGTPIPKFSIISHIFFLFVSVCTLSWWRQNPLPYSLLSVYLSTLILLFDCYLFYRIYWKKQVHEVFGWLHIIIVLFFIFQYRSMISISNYAISQFLWGDIMNNSPYKEYIKPALMILTLIIFDFKFLIKQKKNGLHSQKHFIPSFLIFISLIFSSFSFMLTRGMPFGIISSLSYPLTIMTSMLTLIIGGVVTVAYLAAVVKRMKNRPINKKMTMIHIIAYLFLLYNFIYTSVFFYKRLLF